MKISMMMIMMINFHLRGDKGQYIKYNILIWVFLTTKNTKKQQYPPRTIKNHQETQKKTKNHQEAKKHKKMPKNATNRQQLHLTTNDYQ